KTTRALLWSIPVVNHTWLEDYFVEWRALTVGLERYIVYPPGVDFGKFLMARQSRRTSRSCLLCCYSLILPFCLQPLLPSPCLPHSAVPTPHNGGWVWVNRVATGNNHSQ
ncbi:hypothetical protein HD554DRAFT_2027502, partial [Boletus coccyginus]